MTELLWTPSPERVARANMTAFVRQVSERWDPSVVDFATLHTFSVDNLASFYSAMWQFFDIVGDMGDDIVIDEHLMPGAKWFPQARLNFAENSLRRRDDGVAIIARSEGGGRRSLSWNELYDSVSRLTQALTASGVGPGDRIVAALPNVPEAVIALLAAASVGAIWSCCSTDSAEQLLLDRIGQLEPKVLIVADGYRYNGKLFRMRERTESLARQMPSLERVIVVPFAGPDAPLPAGCNAVSWNEFIAPFTPGAIAFPLLPFDHPLWVLYSSGTTGKPKAIIHGAGACLLNGLKGSVLHMDLDRDERIFFYTSTGWMVWNTMLSGLAWQSPIVLYDGSATHPTMSALFDVIAEERVNIVRIVPSLIDAYIKADLFPAETHDLAALKCVAAGSAPLLPHHYNYVYSRIKKDLHLMSPSGGTDIIGSFVTGNPTGSVYAGEIQAPSLGMDVQIFDENAHAISGQAGELVCTKPFPSMPLGFWGDGDNKRYIDSYFSMFPNVWRQGDWAESTPRGGFIIHGRADATLNVNGVRIGTAEIYRGLEGIREIEEAVAVAQRAGDAERIVLFVVLSDGIRLDDASRQRMKDAIRAAASSRHVPEKIVQVADVPRSSNGKPSEIAVRDAIHGRTSSGRLGLSNPESLELFRDIPELKS
jgi:acetoacetyl-CoA synthetase